MKVNMSMIDDENLKAKAKQITEPVEEVKEMEAGVLEEEDDEFDNSDKHSKLKTVFLVGTMLVGLGLFVWNMTGLVNNMRLDNQGSASSIVYEMQELGNFLGGSEGSSATDAGDVTEGETSTEAIRDGPEDSSEETKAYANESEEMEALRQELKDAKNEAALVKQELKNAEDMLNSALTREDEGASSSE